MVGRKKLDKRQEAQLAKARKAVEDFHQQRRLLTEARFELQQTLVKDVTKLSKIPEDRKPLPATYHKALKKYENVNLKLLSKRPISSASSFRKVKRAPLEYALVDRSYHAANIWPFCFESYFLRPKEYFYHGGFSRGYNGATQISNKYVSGFAGTAALTGDNVHRSNQCDFGFSSWFNLTDRGKEIDVTVSTHVDVEYAWLVALSFGKVAFGHVSVESASGISIQDAEQVVWSELPGEENIADGYNGEILIEGISPGGNWQEGDIGVWSPSRSSDDAYNSFSFSVTVPEDRDVLVYMWETITLVAYRYHPWRTDRCAAVAQVTCRFDPIKVQIQKKC